MDAFRSLTIGSEIGKATSSEEAPTPGHLYIDLAKLSHSTQEAADKLEADIFKILKSSNPNTKLKVLKIIKYLCKNGRSSLQRGFQRNNAEIKEALQFRGPPDALKGDTPYRLVREAAKEALDAVFDTTITAKDPDAPTVGGTRPMEAYGSSVGYSSNSGVSSARAEWDRSTRSSSSSYNSGGGGGGGSTGQVTYGSSGMSAISNYDPSKDKSTLDVMKERAASVATAVISTAAQMSAGTRGSISSGFPPGIGSNSGAPGYNFANNRQDNNYTPSNYSAPSGSTSWGATTVGSSKIGGADSSGEYEANIINDLCAPGGMRPTPPAEKLISFVKGSATLNAEVVGPLLDEKLYDDSWQVRIKALCVIEALLKDSTTDQYTNYFKEYSEGLQGNKDHERPNVRARARKVLSNLGLGNYSAAETGGGARGSTTTLEENFLDIASSPVASKSSGPPSSDDILSLFASPSASTTSVKPPLSAGPADMFSGLTVSSSPAAVNRATSSATNSLDAFGFGGMSVNTSTPAATSSASGGGMFSGMSLSPAPSKAPVASSGFDMFSNLTVSSPAPSASKPFPVTDPFGSIGGLSSLAVPAPKVTTPSTNFSAFDSLKGGGSLLSSPSVPPAAVPANNMYMSRQSPSMGPSGSPYGGTAAPASPYTTTGGAAPMIGMMSPGMPRGPPPSPYNSSPYGIPSVAPPANSSLDPFSFGGPSPASMGGGGGMMIPQKAPAPSSTASNGFGFVNSSNTPVDSFNFVQDAMRRG